jgi:dihydroorotase
MSRNGALARNLAPNEDTIVLERVVPYKVPENHDYGDGQTVAYLLGGEMLEWKVVAGAGPR